MEADLEQLLKDFPNLELNYGTKRIRCKLSGHEMPCKYEAVQSYLSGKKYKKAKEDSQFSLGSYEPYIVPSTKMKKKLFCRLTGKYINQISSHVEKHVSGRKYETALRHYKGGDRELIDEMTKVKSTDDFSSKMLPHGNTLSDADEDSLQEVQFTRRKHKMIESECNYQLPSKKKRLLLERKERCLNIKGKKY